MTMPRFLRERGIAVSLVLAFVFALVACSPSGTTLTGPKMTNAQIPDRKLASEWARGLAAALSNHDTEACRQYFAAATPTWFCANLVQVPQLAISLGDLSSKGFVTQWVWDPTGSAPVIHRWSLNYAVKGRQIYLVAPIEPEVRGNHPAPLWVLEPVTITTASDESVVMYAKHSPSGLPQATAALQRFDFGKLMLNKSKPVLYVVPSSRGVAETTSREQLAKTAAITTTLSDVEPNTGIQVVLNPEEPSHDSVLVLTHEGVHAVLNTLSWKNQGQMWLAEGLADTVAMATSPDDLARSETAIKAYVAAHGIPTNLPDDSLFSSTQTDAAYGLSRLAVQTLIAHLGQSEAMEALAAWKSGEQPTSVTIQQLTFWWRTELEKYR